MPIDIPFLAGIAGMCCILAGFFLVQSHRLSQDSLKYDLLNFIGSALLVWYGVVGEAWPFVMLNSIWGLYSLKDIIFSDMKQGKVIRKG